RCPQRDRQKLLVMDRQHRADRAPIAQYLVSEVRRATGAACLLLGIALLWLFVWTLLGEQHPRYVDPQPVANDDASAPVRATEPVIVHDAAPAPDRASDDLVDDDEIAAVAIPGPAD